MEKGSGSVAGGSVRMSMGGGGDGARRLSNLRHGSVSLSEAADDVASLNGAGVDVPKRKSSLHRQPSLTKGFL